MTIFKMLGGLLVVALVSLGVYFFGKPEASSEKLSLPTSQLEPQEGKLERPSSPITPHTTVFSGEILGGSSSLLLNFKKGDYDEAVASGKLVLLYFYADWCPICRAEFPKIQAAFHDLTTDQVTGFRVNYKDDMTDQDELALAKEFGVAYQHTKVFLRNGRQISKHPDSWEKDRYLSEIKARLNQ